MSNNVQQTPIWMHSGLIGTHSNAQERTGAHFSAQERLIMSKTLHCERPINARTTTHLPSAGVVADVLFFVMLVLRRLLG